MKKTILSALVLLFSLVGHAQNTPTGMQDASTRQEEWLPSFSELELDGSFRIVLIQQPDSLPPKIVYDTKGYSTSRFRANVKDKILYISERSDARRPEPTTVKLYLSDRVQRIAVYNAECEFGNLLFGNHISLTVGGHAQVRAEVDVQDLKVDLTDRSMITLSGEARYLWITAASGEVKASELKAMAVKVEARNSSVVSVQAEDRLEAQSSTKAVINYKGSPSILLTSIGFMGGEINRLQ